ncbi:hypothetical protein NSK_001996 [Nannochloropsis salina CCMP1776]|jgi:hypothetical protein|uniref:Acid phosphatase n=1 Tax=Nannochloropsis salina CCMP1776 TaxID=1027361 RepID=A0A4D9DDY5_9STRA|nr:hypothetical protein NSK_001996 [Nannochloropsis salina CCMP1776]|eukprot:TFJ86908.1 hypothetical protein NSK_001996 [Nannochloropsis salina CCMP1776]
MLQQLPRWTLTAAFSAAALSSFSGLPFESVQGELVLSYVVLRHGARNMLPKTSTLQESNVFGGPNLLPEGQQQCYEVGKEFRERYLDLATCARTGTCLTPHGTESKYGVVDTNPDLNYNNFNTLFNSSALHRTLLSASSFLSGAFGGEACNGEELHVLSQPPVFSTEEGQDWRIRAYTKCPTYDRDLERWFQSPEFRAKEAESLSLRTWVQALAGPAVNVSLAEWWNVYDRFQVRQASVDRDEVPQVLDDETYEGMVALAMWLETAKMRSSLVQNRVGGGLLADVLGRMEQAVQHRETSFPPHVYRLTGVAAHYNTLLGVLASLQADQVANSTLPWVREKIPALAAVLIFELHAVPAQGGEEYLVRLMYQDGPGEPYQGISLPCSRDGDADHACPLREFFQLGAPQALSASEWCAACGNRDVWACQAGGRGTGKLRSRGR